MDRKLKVTFSNASVIAFFLFLTKNCLYLLDTSAINIMGKLNYADFWLGLFIIYAGYIFFTYTDTKEGEPLFKYNIIAVVVICLLASFQAHRLFGQSMSWGIRPQRFFVVIILSYFALRKIFVEELLDIDTMQRVIINFAIIEAVMSIIQQVFYKYIVFMHCMTNYRYGSIRLYLSGSVITLAMFFALERLINKIDIGKNVFIICAGVVYLLVVSKGRLTTVATISALVGGFMIMKGVSARKFLYAIILVLCLFGFSRTQMYKNLTDVIRIENGEITGDTMDIRNDGRNYYLSKVSENPILGKGYPNELNRRATTASGYYDKLMLNDNGIFGILYVYGYLGLFVFMLLFIRLAWLGWQIYRHSNVYFTLMYLILIAIQAINVASWYWQYDGVLIFVLVICMTEAIYINTVENDEHKQRKHFRIVLKR